MKNLCKFSLYTSYCPLCCTGREKPILNWEDLTKKKETINNRKRYKQENNNNHKSISDRSTALVRSERKKNIY